jgi:CRISPR/Cas system-associated endonuclease/helicase Cas3
METDAYMNEDLLYKGPRYMTEKEKKEYAILKESEKRYKKYAPLESICNYCF